LKLDLKRERDETKLSKDKPGECYAGEFLQSTVSVEVGDGDPCGSKNAKVIDVLETTEAPKNDQVGIRASPPKRGQDQ